MQPEIQSYWSTKTGYIPVNNKSKDEPDLIAALEATPVYQGAPKQLTESPNTPATAGVALGAYPDGRVENSGGVTKIVKEGADPETTLQEVVDKANAAIADYNTRLGL